MVRQSERGKESDCISYGSEHRGDGAGMSNMQIKYWEEGKHILIKADNWDCFLLNKHLNPLINWLNLHKQDFEAGSSCKGGTEDVFYLSVNGTLMIKTNRDVVFLTKQMRKEFVDWLNEHRKILNIHEVSP